MTCRECGSVDGSEDHEIHCLKDGSVAADARPAISEATSQLASENDSSSDIEDLFASADEDEGIAFFTFHIWYTGTYPPQPSTYAHVMHIDVIIILSSVCVCALEKYI